MGMIYVICMIYGVHGDEDGYDIWWSLMMKIGMIYGVHGDVPEVPPKEGVHWKPSTFSQDVPTGHVYCRLKIDKKCNSIKVYNKTSKTFT